MTVCVYVSTSGFAGVRARGVRCPGGGSHRQLEEIRCCCWEPNLGPGQEQSELFPAASSPAPRVDFKCIVLQLPCSGMEMPVR